MNRAEKKRLAKYGDVNGIKATPTVGDYVHKCTLSFVKALDDDGIAFNKIEVFHTESGKPYINQTKYINSILKEHFKSKVEISISHCKEYATAVVLVE
jgi:phosphopantetheinyl transferase (holo-ACP synthase)